MEPDFSGYATKAGLVCADGLTIMPDAFKHQDNTRVPLMWQHGHSDPENVIGHAILENRADGMYAYGYFNNTSKAKHAKELLTHQDINSMSIYAKKLVQKSKQLFHGAIKEVSLVISGANPGALIDYVRIAHSDGFVDELDDEAIIYTGLELFIQHEEGGSQGSEKTVADVYTSMSEEQKNVVHFMIGKALEDKGGGGDAEHFDNYDEHFAHYGGAHQDMNVFEQYDDEDFGGGAPTLSHDDLQIIVEDAKRLGSLKESFLAHNDRYGIGNLELLFPDAKAIDSTPEFVKRRTEWVAGVINGTRKSPFSRIKTLSADLTYDEARAKGYIKATLKKEEYFELASRTTTPTTVYKKQKMDRDDIIDITTIDVIAWLKAEMRLMLDEELAGAVLVGDGREGSDPDKIKDPSGQDGAGIRAISHEPEFYAPVTYINTSAPRFNPDKIVEGVIRAMAKYEGSGSPVCYMARETLVDILLKKDRIGRRIYDTKASVAAAMGVSSIVEIPQVILDRDGNDENPLLAIIVNLKDYTLGADKGGEINFFDDFDIDYNQHKYLYETRVSGALTKYRSAVLVRDGVNPEPDPNEPEEVTPLAPTFSDHTISVPTVEGVIYQNLDGGDEDISGTEIILTDQSGAEETTILAIADDGYVLADGEWEWTYLYSGLDN